jgi:hypothetical protein
VLLVFNCNNLQGESDGTRDRGKDYVDCNVSYFVGQKILSHGEKTDGMYFLSRRNPSLVGTRSVVPSVTLCMSETINGSGKRQIKTLFVMTTQPPEIIDLFYFEN